MNSIFSLIKQNKILAISYVLVLLLMIPVVKGIISEHEDVTGYLVSINPNVHTSTHKSVTTTRYYAVFHFEEYGDRQVSVQKRTFENGKKGDAYTFLRKHVNNDGYTFFFMIVSAFVLLMFCFLTFFLAFFLFVTLTEKHQHQHKS